MGTIMTWVFTIKFLSVIKPQPDCVNPSEDPNHDLSPSHPRARIRMKMTKDNLLIVRVSPGDFGYQKGQISCCILFILVQKQGAQGY